MRQGETVADSLDSVFRSIKIFGMCSCVYISFGVR